MKTLERIFPVFLLAGLLCIGAVIVLSPDIPFSEDENRLLLTRSAISGNLLSGAFERDAETYLSDQFPMRTAVVRLQTSIKLLSGKKDFNGVYVGKERLLQKITDADVDLAELNMFAERLTRLKVKYPDLSVTVMPVPSAGIELPEALPCGAKMYDPDPIYDIYGSCAGCTVIDLRKTLRSPGFYYRTDHHWTTGGACAAYNAWRLYHGQSSVDYDDFVKNSPIEGFCGSLSGKAPGVSAAVDRVETISVPDNLNVTADGKAISLYCVGAAAGKDKYLVFFGGNYGVVTVSNPNVSQNKRLLLIKDSFANSLVPFLIADYGEIIMVDERYAAVSLADLVETYRPTELAVVRELCS